MSNCYGTVGPLSIGDCGPESSNIIDTKNITKNITNSVQQSMSSNTDDTISNQTQNVNISGLNPNCCSNFTVKQLTNLKLIKQDKITNEFSSNIGRAIVNSIDNSIDAAMSSNKGTLAGADVSKLKTSMKNYVENYFESNTNKSNIAESAKKVIGNQVQNVNIQCANYINDITNKPTGPISPSNCNIDQTFLLDSFSQSVIDNVFKDIQNDSAVNEAMNGLKSSLVSKSEGISDVISAWMGPIIIIAIVLFIVLGIVAYFFLKSDKKISGPGGFSVGRIRGHHLPSTSRFFSQMPTKLSIHRPNYF